MKAIRARCLDCSAGSTYEIKLCPCVDCALYPYRFGKRPSTVRKMLTKDKKIAETPSKLTTSEQIGIPEKLSEAEE